MVKESNYEIIKFVNGEVELEVTISPYEETVWMNPEQIVKLFNSILQDKKNISNIAFNVTTAYKLKKRSEFTPLLFFLLHIRF